MNIKTVTTNKYLMVVTVFIYLSKFIFCEAMNNSKEHLINKTVDKLYPALDGQNTVYMEDSINNICKGALNNSKLQNDWLSFKEKSDIKFSEYKSLTFDTELVNNVPSLRYGLELVNNDSYLTTISFYVSLLLPFYGWYFIDREKYPKNETKVELGPTKDVFYQYGLGDEYERVNRGELESILSINLPQSDILEFFEPHLRFQTLTKREKEITDFLGQQATEIFQGYEYLPSEIGKIEAKQLAPKRMHPFKFYTYFDCLFTRNLSYL